MVEGSLMCEPITSNPELMATTAKFNFQLYSDFSPPISIWPSDKHLEVLFVCAKTHLYNHMKWLIILVFILTVQPPPNYRSCLNST